MLKKSSTANEDPKRDMEKSAKLLPRREHVRKLKELPR
jgi:hypothetical protein